MMEMRQASVDDPDHMAQSCLQVACFELLCQLLALLARCVSGQQL